MLTRALPHQLGAELFALRRRPGLWALAAVWAAEILVFAYAVIYAVWLGTASSLPAGEAASLLESVLPAGLDTHVLRAYATYYGPVALILGALLSSGDYRWGTLRTILSRQGDRAMLLLGRSIAMAAATGLLALMTLVLSAVCSTVIAAVEGQAFSAPTAGDLLRSLGGLWLASTAYASAGFALGMLTRGVAPAIGIGLVWTWAVENVIGLAAGALPLFETIRQLTLSGSTDALAASLGANTFSFGGSLPGGPMAAAVLTAYIAISLAVSLAVFRRRDVT